MIPKLTTEEALIQHIQAVKAQDLDGIADGYSDDAIFLSVTNADGKLEKKIVQGKEAIKSVFKSVFENILLKSSSMEFTNEIAEGEVGYITWKAQSSGFTIPDATDTFVIRNGKIVVQTGFTILNSIK